MVECSDLGDHMRKGLMLNLTHMLSLGSRSSPFYISVYKPTAVLPPFKTHCKKGVEVPVFKNVGNAFTVPHMMNSLKLEPKLLHSFVYRF